MEVGKHDRNRPRCADLVKMLSAQPLGAKEDRIKPPADKRPALRQGRFRCAQALHHGVNRLHPRPELTIRIDTVVIASIGILPHRARHHMRVTLHKAGHENRVLEAIVIDNIAPLSRAVLTAHRENMSVLHGNMAGTRAVWIHCNDLARRKNSNLAHDSLPL